MTVQDVADRRTQPTYGRGVGYGPGRQASGLQRPPGRGGLRAADEVCGRFGHRHHKVIARTTRPLVLYESGFAPRWYVPREDIQEKELTPVEGQTFCLYKGLASYYDIGEAKKAAWSYREAYTEVGRVDDLVSFEPDKVEVYLDGERLHLEPGQQVVPHGVDRGLGTDEVLSH